MTRSEHSFKGHYLTVIKIKWSVEFSTTHIINNAKTSDKNEMTHGEQLKLL
jgi:hypothetical protein